MRASMTAHLDIDPEAFAKSFGRAPFPMRHGLAGHELFALPRLVELAQRLPASAIEYNAGDVPLSLDPARTPRNGLSAEETIRRIEECRSWMVLKFAERDPRYAELLASCLDEIDAFPKGYIKAAHAFIFVSSPGSVTPFHMDPEENFLLQLRGEKTIQVFDPADRAVVSERELERFCGGAHRNLEFRDSGAGRGRAFVLHTGDGVHVPFVAPHWVENGAEVSISFSVTFQTPESLARLHAYRGNALLRRVGVSPAPVGSSPLGDSLKRLASRVFDRARGMHDRARAMLTRAAAA
jgi:hypothetical protein